MHLALDRGNFSILRLQDLSSENLFLGQILREGRVLVDRECVWPELLGRADALTESGRTQDRERMRVALSEIDRVFGT